MLFSWDSQAAHKLVCIEKYPETHDTFSFRFADHGETQVFDFKPGQFINLGVEIDGRVEYRSYSLSSLPFDDYIQVTIKRVKNGRVSNFLIDHLLVGDEVEVYAPMGNFNYADNCLRVTERGKQHVLLISAGCGAAPVFAMAKALLLHDENIDVTYLHIARTAQDIIYAKELLALEQCYHNLHLKFLLKDATGTSHAQGRLNQQWLTALAPHLNESNVYLCGPSQFMSDVKCYLEAEDFDMNYFFYESFTPQITSNESDSPALYDVTVLPQGRAYSAGKGELLADVLQREGLPIIIACRSGICGSCRCKVTSGNLVRHPDHVLSNQEKEDGFVLACCAEIDSAVSVDIA